MADGGGDNNALLLQISADLKKLEGNFKKAAGVVDAESGKIEKRSKKMADKIEENAGKADIGKALTKVFDSSRLKVLDTGAAKIGVFGSALEDLGPAGIAGAAGIGAVWAAMAGAREAAKFADDISDTAKRLHVTTDALQEYRYAIRAAGGDEAGADSALEAFSVTLGKAQQGLPKAVKAFKDMGFTDKQIKGFRDADDALQQVTEKIAGLSSVKQDAIIERLGLDGLKPLIEGGVDAMSRLRDEAHKVGVVMDSELVKRGGDLNDQFETVNKVIDVQLKSALVDLGPILVGLIGLVAQMATGAADIVDSFRSIENRSQKGLKDRVEDIDALLKSKRPTAVIMKDGKIGRLALREGHSDDELLAEKAQIEQALATRGGGGTSRSDWNMRHGGGIAPPASDGGGGGGGGGSRIDKAAIAKRADDALKAQADSAFATLQSDQEKAWAQYNEDAAKFKAALDAKVWSAQKYHDAMAKIQDRLDFDPAFYAKGKPDGPTLGTMPDKDIEPFVASAQNLITVTHPLLDDARAIGDVFEDSFNRAGGSMKDFGAIFAEELESMAMQWLAAKAAGFLFGDKDSNGDRSGGAIDSLFGHNAAGTDNWRGGPTWVHEGGKELINLPKGTQIIPNNRVHSFNGIQRQGGAMNVSLHSTYEIAGAIGKDEIAGAITQAHNSAVQSAVQQVRKNFGSISGSYQKMGR